VHGGANTRERHTGDIGNIVAKDDGIAFFNVSVRDLPLEEIKGRTLACMSGEGHRQKNRKVRNRGGN
jgi:Cu/Zn superoxide dismutase